MSTVLRQQPALIGKNEIPGKIFGAQTTSNRVFGLDIIRAFAIFFVMIGHSVHALVPSQEKAMINTFSFLPDKVAVFFVLSGFLIGRILINNLEKEKASWPMLFHFWKMRWYRTLPAYLVMLTLMILISLLFSNGFTNVSSSSVLKYYVFCQNLFSPHPPFFTEVWSLSVEEWFYLLVPLSIFALVIAGKFKPRHAILSVIITVVLSAIIIRYFRYLSIQSVDVKVWDLYFRKQVITRMDSILFGLAGAYISCYYPLIWKRYKKHCLLLGIAGVFLLYASQTWFFSRSVFYYCNISFIFTGIVVLLFLPFLSEYRKNKGLFYKVITYISLISYSLFLTHYSFLIDQILLKIGPLQAEGKLIIATRFILFWILDIIIATALYKLVEAPFMAMRNKKMAERKKSFSSN